MEENEKEEAAEAEVGDCIIAADSAVVVEVLAFMLFCWILL